GGRHRTRVHPSRAGADRGPPPPPRPGPAVLRQPGRALQRRLPAACRHRGALRAAADPLRSDVPRPGRPSPGSLGRPPHGDRRPRPRRSQPDHLRWPGLARDRGRGDGRRRPPRRRTRAPLGLLPEGGHPGHADDGRPDGLPQHPPRDRDHGQPRAVGRQRRRRPGRRLHPDDRPPGPLDDARHQAAALRRVGPRGRHDGPLDPAPLHLPERALVADRAGNLRGRLRDHLRGVALVPRRRGRPGDPHLGQHAARRPAGAPAGLVAGALSRHRPSADGADAQPLGGRAAGRAGPAGAFEV
ncbi:MAG: ABC transporter, permease protein 2 (cluster 5, nickel/peptides/opines), partial [uncultured Thermomicrobiales bacterium]